MARRCLKFESLRSQALKLRVQPGGEGQQAQGGKRRSRGRQVLASPRVQEEGGADQKEPRQSARWQESRVSRLLGSWRAAGENRPQQAVESENHGQRAEKHQPSG